MTFMFACAHRTAGVQTPPIQPQDLALLPIEREKAGRSPQNTTAKMVVMADA